MGVTFQIHQHRPRLLPLRLLPELPAPVLVLRALPTVERWDTILPPEPVMLVNYVVNLEVPDQVATVAMTVLGPTPTREETVIMIQNGPMVGMPAM